jgi:hypothetical protein
LVIDAPAVKRRRDSRGNVVSLELRATDILAVRAARPVTSVWAAELRSRLERPLGLPGRVLVLEPGTELTVFTAADPITKTDVPPDPES